MKKPPLSDFSKKAFTLPESRAEYEKILKSSTFKMAETIWSEENSYQRAAILENLGDKPPVIANSIRFAENLSMFADHVLEKNKCQFEYRGCTKLTVEGAAIFPELFTATAELVCKSDFQDMPLDYALVEKHLADFWLYGIEVKHLLRPEYKEELTQLLSQQQRPSTPTPG